MSNQVLIAIAVFFIGVPLVFAVRQLIKVLTSDKITFMKGDKKITISSPLNSADREKLANF